MEATGFEAAVLCGGRGERLRPVEPALPKALVKVGGRPVLAHIIDSLIAGGCSRIVLCAGHGKEAINEWAEGSGFSQIVVSVEPAPAGTAGALKHAEPLLSGQQIVVTNGDTLCDVDFSRFLTFHRSRSASAALAVAQADDVREFGRVEFAADGTVLAFHEKVRSGPGWINAGAYVLERSILAGIPPDVACSLEREVIPSLIGRRLFAFPVPGSAIDIGTPERLRLARDAYDRMAGRA